jgi:hypothetical protein
VKIKNFALVVFFMAAAYGFSQETGNALDAEDRNAPPPVSRLLLHTEGYFSKTWYQWGDGTPAQYRDVLAHVATVPENESLVRQEKLWRNATYTTAVLFLASLAGTVVYNVGGFDTPWVLDVCLYTGLFSFLSNITAGNTANIKLQCAVDRYNLHIGLGR